MNSTLNQIKLNGSTRSDISKEIFKRIFTYTPATGIPFALYFLVPKQNLFDPIFLGLVLIIFIENYFYMRKTQNYLNHFGVMVNDIQINQAAFTMEKISPIFTLIKDFNQSMNFIQRSDFIYYKGQLSHESERLNKIAQLRLLELINRIRITLGSDEYSFYLNSKKFTMFFGSENFAKIEDEILKNINGWELSTKNSILIADLIRKNLQELKENNNPQALVNKTIKNINEIIDIRNNKIPEQRLSPPYTTQIGISVVVALEGIAYALCYLKYNCSFSEIIHTIGTFSHGLIFTLENLELERDEKSNKDNS